MKQTCLLISVALLFATRRCLGACDLETVQGVPQYLCNSVQEYEEQGNSNAFDATINKPSDTSDKQLNLKIALVEDATTNGISSDTFRLLKELAIHFKKNQDVNTLSASLFANLPIEELYLHNNGITNIVQGAFSTLQYLQKLDIIDNKLSTVKNGVFNNLQVDSLALSRNRISFIEKDAFKGMAHLKMLHLDGNRLSEFQSEIVMNHPLILEELWLQNNFFTDIDRNTLRGFTNLKQLNLDNNRIVRCASYTFDDTPNIEVLSLGGNLLQDFKGEAFPSNGMEKLRKLYIHDNHLSYVTTLALEKLRKLEHIRIGGNPWQCPCFQVMLTWFSDHNVQQNCDQEYYNGTRPSCVIHPSHPTRCVYEFDNYYFDKYSETNSKHPPSRDCIL